MKKRFLKKRDYIKMFQSWWTATIGIKKREVKRFGKNLPENYKIIKKNGKFWITFHS